MKEIKQIQELLVPSFDINKLVKFHLMINELENKLNKKMNSGYKDNQTLRDVMMNYTRFKESIDGIWNGRVNILRCHNELMNHIKEIKERVNSNKILELMDYDIDQSLNLHSFMPRGPAMKDMYDAFMETLSEFDELYENMMNTSHTDKIRMLKKYINIPRKHQKDFIQESEDTRWNSDVTVSISYKENEETVITKVFYLSNWEVMTSTNSNTKKTILKSAFTTDKEKVLHFWPEEYL